MRSSEASGLGGGSSLSTEERTPWSDGKVRVGKGCFSTYAFWPVLSFVVDSTPKLPLGKRRKSFGFLSPVPGEARSLYATA